MTELSPYFWLPSNVLSDDEENDALQTSQEAVWLNELPESRGSSPSCGQGKKGSEAWDSLDAVACEFKANEVNWKKDFQCDWSSANNIDINAFTTWNSINHTENSSILPKQFLREKPCPVPSGWWKQTKPKQGHSMRIPENSYPPWASVQDGGSDMKAVFLESNGLGRESGGTGVFLPRGAGNVFDSKKKKSGCSTVLLPYRVVQALNLAIQNMNSQPSVRSLDNSKHRSICGRKIDNNKPLTREGWSRQPKKDFYPVNLNTQALPPEISLPQDWTY